MNEIITLYHGSNIAVANPEILVTGYYKDFGYGFYCTNIEKQAHKWTLAKFKYPTHQMVFCTQRALTTLKYERSYSV